METKIKPQQIKEDRDVDGQKEYLTLFSDNSEKWTTQAELLRMDKRLYFDLLEKYSESKSNKLLAAKLAEEADVDYNNPDENDEEDVEMEDEEYVQTKVNTPVRRSGRGPGRPRKEVHMADQPNMAQQQPNQIITSEDAHTEESPPNEQNVKVVDHSVALEEGSFANNDIPDFIEGLVKRRKKLDAVIVWKERTQAPKVQDQEGQEELEGDLSRELTMNAYGKGFKPKKSLMPFDEILKNHKSLALQYYKSIITPNYVKQQ